MNLILYIKFLVCVISVECNLLEGWKKYIRVNKIEDGNSVKNDDSSLENVIIKNAKNNVDNTALIKDGYSKDDVLNFFNTRRKQSSTSTEDLTSSSSLEEKPYKNEWQEFWIKKKLDAINSTIEKADVVNMVGARPWGVACGDPKQHDMPWGTCMLPMECDAEYRIYRGDFLCGRTQFVCCALQLTSYDLYQAFDVSFADSELTTDSEEKRNRERGSKERKKRKKRKDKHKRRQRRLRRKRKIKKHIKKIVRQIRKLLNRSYRNGTRDRKRKTKKLKKFIKELKHKYKQDRERVKIAHEVEIYKIDAALQKKLKDIKEVNNKFVGNETFREMVLNGSKALRTLGDANPSMSSYFDQIERRSGSKPHKPDYLDYDIEYGMV